MGKVISDIFEKLYDDTGYGEIEVNIFGKTCKLELIIEKFENEEFEEIQHEAYQKFMQNIEGILKQGEEAAFKYYLDVFQDYRDRSDDESKDKIAPVIKSQDELYELIEPTTLLFPAVFGRDVREFGILCECRWEVEHGLAVKYHNEKVVEAGYQDIII